MGMKLAGIMFILMLAGGSAFGWYFKESQAKIAVLHENNAKLEIAVETEKAATEALQADMKKINEELTRVNNEFANIRAQNQELTSKLARHDIAALAQQKPGSVQRVINGASQKAMRCFEILSGAPLNDNEKGATSARAFNSECPWLWPGAAAN